MKKIIPLKWLNNGVDFVSEKQQLEPIQIGLLLNLWEIIADNYIKF